MIEYLKENYLWIGALIIPIVVAIIGLFSRTKRKQKIGYIKGNGNTIINGDCRK